MLPSGRRLHGIASGQLLLCTTPQSPAATAPASRGALGMAQSLMVLPRPPLLGNNDDHRQWRKQGGVVGAAASRTQVQTLARSGRWEPQPVRWHCEAMTVGFFLSPENFFQKIPKRVKGICVSCIIESETAKIQHKTARHINAAGVRISRTALLHAIYYRGS